MGFFSSLFGGGEKKAAEAQARAAREAMAEQRMANERANQARLDAERRSYGYLDPYIQRGNRATDQYHEALNEMSDQPGFYESIMRQYKPSAGYEHRFNEGNRAITQGFHANGMYGSGDYIKALMEHGQNLANQDQQQYLDNILGIRGGYLSGLSGIGNTGFNASTNLSNITANTGQGMASDWNNLSGQLGQQYGILGEANANRERARARALQQMFGLGISGIGGLATKGFSGGLSRALGGGFNGLMSGLGYNRPSTNYRNSTDGLY